MFIVSLAVCFYLLAVLSAQISQFGRMPIKVILQFIFIILIISSCGYGCDEKIRHENRVNEKAQRENQKRISDAIKTQCTDLGGQNQYHEDSDDLCWKDGKVIAVIKY